MLRLGYFFTVSVFAGSVFTAFHDTVKYKQPSIIWKSVQTLNSPPQNMQGCTSVVFQNAIIYSIRDQLVSYNPIQKSFSSIPNGIPQISGHSMVVDGENILMVCGKLKSALMKDILVVNLSRLHAENALSEIILTVGETDNDSRNWLFLNEDESIRFVLPTMNTFLSFA